MEDWNCGESSKDLCKVKWLACPGVTKLGANLGRSDDFQAGSGNQPDGSDLERGQQQARDFAPRLSLKKVAALRSSRGWRAIRGVFDFQLPIYKRTA